MARSNTRTLAAFYREHRRVFDFALANGITPKEAELELERRATRARWEQAQARLRIAMEGAAVRPAGADEPWMMRD